MNKYGRHGISVPSDFLKYAEIMRIKELSNKYGVCCGVINRWRRISGLTDGVSHARKITWDVSNDGCWNCTSHKLNKKGYPEGKRSIGRWSIAKVMFEEKFGKVKEGLVIRHKCDNRACINPDHLETGTLQDNLRDAYVRRRNSFGEQHGNAKLSVKKIEFARRLRLNGLSYVKIAKKVGVSDSTLWLALNFKTWRRARDLD